MRLLLDTHALLWFVQNDARLGKHLDTIADPANEILVSTVSLFEIGIKTRAGKLRVNMADLLAEIERQDFEFLPLLPAHIVELSKLPVIDGHKDPFDHQLIAQALSEDLIFLSLDRQASRYPVRLLA